MSIRVALTNLGKYNEGELVYTWLELPATQSEIDEAFEIIGVDFEEYEEYFISDYEAPFSIYEYSNLTRLNELAERLTNADGFEAIASGTYDAGDVYAFAASLGKEDHVSDIVTDEDLDMMVARVAQEDGWQRAACFLAGIKYMNDDYYRINGYGNAENLDRDYLKSIIDEVIQDVTKEVE